MKKVTAKTGSVLIAVLWSLFFLTALALVIHASIAPQLTLAASLRDRVTLRSLAEAGVQRSLLELRSDETEEYDALNSPWASDDEAFKEIFLTDVGYFSVEHDIAGEEGEAGKRYGLTDEERKININTAPVDVLTRLFVNAGGASDQEAKEIAESVGDWRDGDDEASENGAESNYYQGLADPYACKNANFDILEELLLVKGVTQEIFDHVKDYLTVYGTGAVNINTADQSVLQWLGIGDDLAKEIVDYRKGHDVQEVTEDDYAFESAQSLIPDLSTRLSLSAEDIEELTSVQNAGLLGVRSDYFRGESYGRFQDREAAVKIIFVVNRDETIHFWREI